MRTSETRAKAGGDGTKATTPPRRADEAHGRRGAKIGSAAEPSIEELQALVVAKRYDEVLRATETAATMAGSTTAESGPNRKVTRAEALALLRSFVLFERQRTEEAESLAMRVLESDPWSSDACILLGISKRRQGLREEAIDWFRKAAYANRACWPAHYYLAELFREQGEGSRAGREYTIVLRALETQAGRDTGLSVVPLGLPTGDIKMVCERRLAERVE
jgi:chemotaxis protein methyltransferase CheR